MKLYYLKDLKKTLIQNSEPKSEEKMKNGIADLEALKKVRFGLNDLLKTNQNYK